MCGIAGILSPNPQKVTLQRIKSATTAIAHRGPEGEGHWINEDSTVALGHRRLSIIDLTPGATQPFYYYNRYILIYNGELYNYVEIKKSLQEKGCRFTTQSDTEVIAAAYAFYKKDCVSYFDGMFAFAIWDIEEEVLFAARDRFGEKPFYFYYNEDQFLFASEIKGLWAAGIKKEVNTALLYNFLTIGYTANPTDPQETFYSNIHKLPTASFLHYQSTSHQLSIEKYWQFDVEENDAITEEDAIEKLNYLLATSVSRRLRSDVAIGTSLSGGLDSSIIVAFCNKLAAGQYTHKSFTASFPHFDKDESEFAAQVATQFNLQHHTVAISATNAIEEMEKIMHHQEQPISSASAIAQYMVYKTAKERGVTVLLDGQGADETLAGYHKYYKWRWQQLYRDKNLHKSGELIAAKELGVQETFGIKNKAAALFPQFAAAMLQTTKAKKAGKHPGLHKDFLFTNKRNSYYTTPAQFDLNSVLYFNTFVYGLEELLHLADRNSMAHAAEIRLPFLSHELVQFIFKLPPHFKIKNGWTKWLLRKTAAPLLPQNIVWRRDKVGFEPPQKVWMQDKELMRKIAEGKKVLANEGILEKQALHKKVQPHSAYAAEPFDWRYWAASFLLKR
ncbi:MAG TPA: asparagine synthase (glutamine-hydrolyzing) [Chitinophagaceae bacterium]|nr:asparagine synthase (glutamine-hydrolyzing) [Chitinophagaceae bacterium]